MAVIPSSTRFNPRIASRRRRGIVLLALFVLAVVVGVLGLVSLLAQILWEGAPSLSLHFLTGFPSRFPDQAGLKPALFGTIWIMGLTGLFAVPVGVGAAIYLEEYAPSNWLTRMIDVNISNLAGVPSIVYGLLGLAVFVQLLGLGRTIVAGALTMSLLVLPVVIIASREAIRAVPNTYREAAYGLGATQFQVVKGVVLPGALPGVMTGTILAMSRAIGEAAPMVAISALAFMTFTPTSPMDTFTVLPIQIFNWVGQPQQGFRGIAAAGIIVLLAVLLSMNAAAIYIRNRKQMRSEE
ncbi:MAG: phosphate ABC transporter permease PstA [Chloroflexi bacterium]|nr:phosphate ABC transporter permease PstA [Chloroflexota bacterium]